MSELLDLAAGVAARARPGEEVEVYVSRRHDTTVRAYDAKVEELTSASTAGVGIRVALATSGAGGRAGAGDADLLGAGRMGFAWAGSLDPAVVAEALEEARANARFASPGDHAVLAVPDGVAPSAVELCHPEFAATSTARKAEMALELEAMVRAADARVRQVRAADYGDSSVETALASTTGVRAVTRRTSAHVAVAAIAGEGTGSRVASGLSVGRAAADLDPGAAAQEAVERAVRLLGARKARSARCTVVFDPRATAALLGALAPSLSGESVVKGRSFFAGRLGEEVADPAVTLVDDATDPRAYRASRFDAEGLASRRTVLVAAGVLRGYLHDTASARRAGSAPTGSAVRSGFAGSPRPGCRALVLEPGSLGAEAILEAVEDGLYVQSVTGVHSGVDPVSGDFSVGAEGLMVRTGALAEPVREITVASTLQRMLGSALHVGSDLRWLPGVAAGQTLAVADMQLSGR